MIKKKKLTAEEKVKLYMDWEALMGPGHQEPSIDAKLQEIKDQEKEPEEKKVI